VEEEAQVEVEAELNVEEISEARVRKVERDLLSKRAMKSTVSSMTAPKGVRGETAENVDSPQS
jgi:hypothetical protein